MKGSGLDVKARLDLARSIARDAGALQRSRIGDPRTIETKSTRIDLVTDVDRASERLILERLDRECPHDGILSEESGSTRDGSSGFCWIIDPLDGTTNYAHAVPHFAVSIGVEQDGERVAGVIYNPMLDELFWAARGEGAWLGDARIEVSRIESLDRALLATGFAYDVQSNRKNNLDQFAAFMLRAQAVRRAGSAALDLAYVACGRFDGFWEQHLAAWDVAAGLILIEEAGGITSDFDGGPAPRSGARTVAANHRLHAEMLSVLATTA